MRDGPKIDKIPSIFPVIREFRMESGSLQTTSTAT